MGLLDNASNFVNRGIASAGRGTKSLSLKAQIGDLSKQREQLAAQLGARLFELTRNDSKFRLSCEPVYAAIEDLDKQLESLQSELLSVERQAHAAVVSQQTMACPVCGGPVGAEDSFCASCGANVADMKKDMRLCLQCGSVLGADDLFCMSCGAPAAPVQTAPVVPATPAVAELGVCQGASVRQDVPVASQPAPFSPAIASDDSLASAVAPLPPLSDDPFGADVTMPIEDFLQTPIGAKAGLCPQCGYENVPEAKFCRNCGQALEV